MPKRATGFVKAETIPSNIKFKRVKIDPILAQKWLDTRELNIRSKRKAKVRNDSADMLAGRWAENGDVIRISEEGELLDGMHRCYAIIEANCEITLWVAFDVPKAAMPTIDIGSSRNFGDYLKMSGEHNHIVQAAITRRLEAWQRGSRISYGGKEASPMVVLKDLYWKNADDIRYAAKIGGDIQRQTQFLRVTSAGLFFLLTSRIDHDQASEFKDRVLDGDKLSQNSPIAALRRRLMSYGANTIDDTGRFAMFINAWNLWRADEPADTIYQVYGAKGKGSGVPLTNANFPEPT